MFLFGPHNPLGIPAAVLGGGPSLPDDLRKLPSHCMMISVNDHAFHHCMPHVMVYQDHIRYAPAVADALEEFNVTIVCPWANSHFELPKGWWDANMSSALATWFACHIGASQVILCGMDCYQGDVKYCHPRPNFDHPIFRVPVEKHQDQWREALEKCPSPERIKAMSGPLVEVFGQYEVEGVKQNA
jgi:hypothetical protein